MLWLVLDDTRARAAVGPVVVDQVKDIAPGPRDGDPMVNSKVLKRR